ncbi:MAG TPA: enoyl-CoA hydratase-related protein [Miltoncostaeaceae bacterium]|nr:enoyl-CoA hydratase-related protein [Miltoncostaeaceae bacterium]
MELERRGRVALITLDRPERLNTLSPDMLDELAARLGEVEADETVGAAVLTGAGEKAFSAGADVSMVREAEARAFAARGHATLDRVEALPKPVIAAVNGYALGGGCELALACDIRLASDRAQIGLPEVTLGIFPGWGGTQRMPRLVGPGKAKELIFTGRRVAADEALALGLVDRVLPHDELVEAAVALAGEIADKPGWAVAASKAMINRAGDGDLAGNLARELDLFSLAFDTEDQREGMAAFLEKRPPRFRGR